MNSANFSISLVFGIEISFVSSVFLKRSAKFKIPDFSFWRYIFLVLFSLQLSYIYFENTLHLKQGPGNALREEVGFGLHENK